MEKRLTIYLTSLRGEKSDTLLKALRILPFNGQTRFDFTKNPEEANIILYLESGYIGLSDINLIRRSFERNPCSMHFLYSESDWPFPVVPGCYCSLSRAYEWAHSWSYLLPNSETAWSLGPRKAKFLYSFLGRVSTHPLRQHILRLSSATTPCLDVNEAVAKIPDFEHVQSYERLLHESLFVLCPRGIGASSVRLFETMRAGRVPVIISDTWVRPPYVPWEKCSVRVAEKDVQFIPDILSRVSDPEEMGLCARDYYANYYSHANFLDRLINHLVSNNPDFADTFKYLNKRIISAASIREIKTYASQLLSTWLPS